MGCEGIPERSNIKEGRKGTILGAQSVKKFEVVNCGGVTGG